MPLPEPEDIPLVCIRAGLPFSRSVSTGEFKTCASKPSGEHSRGRVGQTFGVELYEPEPATASKLRRPAQDDKLISVAQFRSEQKVIQGRLAELWRTLFASREFLTTPKRYRGQFSPDFGVATPKQSAKSLVQYG